MQQELLIEIFGEEIPARLQKKAILDSNTVFTNILNEVGAKYSLVETYISPRRITLRVQYLFPKTNDLFEEKRGPKVDSTKNSINGFLKANNKTK